MTTGPSQASCIAEEEPEMRTFPLDPRAVSDGARPGTQLLWFPEWCILGSELSTDTEG